MRYFPLRTVSRYGSLQISRVDSSKRSVRSIRCLVMIPSRVAGDLLAGMWRLVADGIGAVPRTLLWDNESGIGQRGRMAGGRAGFCGVLGTRLIHTRPYDLETKGLVERANDYLAKSFLPSARSSRRSISTSNSSIG